MAAQFKYEHLPENEELKKVYHPLYVQDYVRVNGYTFPERYKKCAKDILEFEVKEDDVFVCSFPKCGTTWTQEMVWCIANDLDFEKAKRTLVMERFPFIEHQSVIPFEEFAKLTDDSTNPPTKVIIPEFASNSVEFVKNLQGRRFIKTHLPLPLLPKQLQTAQRKAKLIYVARDPRDACISYYYHNILLHGYTGDLSTFIKLFLNDSLTWTPFWQHVLGYWNIRHEPNMLFITYEEMKRDLPAVIERVATFLDKTLSPDQVAALAHHLSFDSMKNNPAVNYDVIANISKRISGNDGIFMRSGQSGGFLKDLSKEEIELFDDWCKKNLEGTDYILAEFKK